MSGTEVAVEEAEKRKGEVVTHARGGGSSLRDERARRPVRREDERGAGVKPRERVKGFGKNTRSDPKRTSAVVEAGFGVREKPANELGARIQSLRGPNGGFGAGPTGSSGRRDALDR